MFRKLKINRVLSALFAFLLAFNAFGGSIAYATNAGTTGAPEGFTSSNTGIITLFRGLAQMADMPNILLIEDVDPWGVTDHHYILQSMGQVRKVSSSALLGINLASYDVIVLSNDQLYSTYQNLTNFMWLLENYVHNGGVLIFGAAAGGWNSHGTSGLTINLPGGVIPVLHEYHWSNSIADFNHPIITGELTNGIALTNDDLNSNFTSFTSFVEDSIPGSSRVILRDPNGLPTLVEYSLGNGTVIASGLTWEHGLRFNDGWHGVFAEVALADLYMYAISIASQNMFFNVSTTASAPGDFVDITVSAANMTSGIAGFAFELEFDNSQLRPVMLMASGSAFNIHTNLTDSSIDTNSLSSVTAVWSNASNVHMDGDLFTVRFNVRPSARAGMHRIDLTGMVTNEDLEDVRFGITPGYIIVTEDGIMYGDILPDGFIDIRDVVKLSQYLAGRRQFNESERLAADVYRDGRVDIRDAIKLSQYLAGHENIILGTR